MPGALLHISGPGAPCPSLVKSVDCFALWETNGASGPGKAAPVRPCHLIGELTLALGGEIASLARVKDGIPVAMTDRSMSSFELNSFMERLYFREEGEARQECSFLKKRTKRLLGRRGFGVTGFGR